MKGEARSTLGFGFFGLFLGMVLSFALMVVYPESGNLWTGKVAEVRKAECPCFRYVGELENAYCDSEGSLNFYFTGNGLIDEGWYKKERHKDCIPCKQLTSGGS